MSVYSNLHIDMFCEQCDGNVSVIMCVNLFGHKSPLSQVTFIYIALLTIQIVTKHCTILK